jgi:hypothetical protein
MKKYSLFLFFILNLNLSFSQITFEKRFGNGDYEHSNYIEQTFDGGYIVAGRAANFPPGSGVPLLMKLDAYGDTVWIKTNFNYQGTFNTVHQLPDSGFIAGGYIEQHSDAFFIVRTSVTGDTLWTKTLSDSTYDQSCNSISTVSAGGFISVTNVTPDTINEYALLLRLDQNGDTIWTKRFYYNHYAFSPVSIFETSDHGFAMAGTNPFTGQGPMFLAHFDSTGDSLWLRTYNNVNSITMNAIATGDGGFMLCGRHINNTAFNALLIKTDALGDTLWTRNYGGTAIDYAIANSVRQTNDGGFIFTGNVVELGGLNFDLTNLYLVKIDSLGNELWAQEYDEVRFESGECVQQTSDGGYVVCGVTSNIYNDGIMDIYVVKTDASGNTITAINSPNPVQNSGIEIFPNPAHAHITISPLPAEAGEIEIYNALGANVFVQSFTCVENKLQVPINLSHGVYFIRIKTVGKVFVPGRTFIVE